jgi:hypothetical protein
MPTSGEVLVSADQVPISPEMNWIDEGRIFGAGGCDEIVNIA